MKRALLVLALLAGCRNWEKFSDAPCVADGVDGGSEGCIAHEACGLCLLECRTQQWDSYDDAVAFCGAWGGRLAEPRDATLNLCFHETVAVDVPQFFIGAVQASGQASPGDGWTWASDGERVEPALWNEGYPSDEDGVEDDAENCSGFTRYMPGINDIHCEFFPTGVLCERPLPR